MSFDANIGRTQPIIKAAANMNNDGGSGGNTGYMMRGRRKDKDDDKKNIFASDCEIDSVDLSGKVKQSEEKIIGYKNSWFENLVEKFIK
ncbi:MAG: hypothetical protein E7Z87_04690 [Cyanobacteria bacterium SIG26]|nr:hypothetical protein [Cyanobacteria bacterium SIG26]